MHTAFPDRYLIRLQLLLKNSHFTKIKSWLVSNQALCRSGGVVLPLPGQPGSSAGAGSAGIAAAETRDQQFSPPRWLFPAFALVAGLGNATLGHVGAARGAFSSGALERAHFSHGTPRPAWAWPSTACPPLRGTSRPLSSRRAHSTSEGSNFQHQPPTGLTAILEGASWQMREQGFSSSAASSSIYLPQAWQGSAAPAARGL